ncbi:hypothetical protein PBT90_20305 [Algoriphagus halophytocola]|uniref:hypothetical protein n=1 Tax=Algoriphagus halophytocola TaxID=2991499 RepID=UPI0022DDF297|nr:hypothetical protein [Algoriphagus sp. TR-M9]WBL43072.1 hypothetical protein PBT90_20305 [Algoriphagus sp. TR-M9]
MKTDIYRIRANSMYYIKVFLITLISTGWLTDPVCTECPQELGKMIQQMLDHKQYDNHKASGRDYYILQNKFVKEDPCIKFGDKMLQLTEVDTGAVFEVTLASFDTLKKESVIEIFLENDNLGATGEFKCQNGEYRLVKISYVMI